MGNKIPFFFGGGGEYGMGGGGGWDGGWGGGRVVCVGDRWMDRQTGGNRFAPSTSSKLGAMK